MAAREPLTKRTPDNHKKKFVYQSPKSIKFQKGVSFPKRFEKIVRGIPEDGEKALAYLQHLVKTKKISPGEFKFILLATRQPGPYKFE